MKICSKCRQEKTYDSFTKSKSRKDGYRPYCKVCRRLLSAERYKKNFEKILAKNYEWRATNRERHNATSKVWNENNKDRKRDTNKKWRIENLERSKENSKRYYDENREKIRDQARDRARKKRGTGSESVVYFISDGEFIKIGYSRMSLEAKISSNQTFNVKVLYLLGSVPGGTSLEKDLHKRFNHLRIRGEWFRDNGEIKEFISREG